MKDKELKVLIIGAGKMGDTHAKAYSAIEGVSVKGIMDVNEERAAELASKYEVEAFSDFEKAIKCEVDFVDICLPTLYHKYAIEKCFSSKLDVVCEKPLSLSSEEAYAISKLAESSGRKLMVAHVVRFWPEYVKLRRMMKSKEITGIKQMTLSRYGAPPDWSVDGWMLSDDKSGGIIFDLAIHDIDYAISLFGMPNKVFAASNMMGENYTAYINAILYFDEINIMIESGFIMEKSYPFTTGFRLSTGRESYEYVNKSGNGLMMYKAGNQGVKVSYLDFDPYVRELEYFTDCIRQNRIILEGSAADAANAVKVAECILRSAKSNQTVEVI